MVNKQKLFKALKEEMEAKAAKKAAQRQLARLRHKVFSGELEKQEKAKKEKEEAKARAEAERKEGIANRKAETNNMFEDNATERRSKKADIMKLLDKLYNDEETGFWQQARAVQPSHRTNNP